jgi:hypothetical protein
VIKETKMRHPFDALPTGKRGQVFLPLLALTLLLMVVLNVSGGPLTTGAAPQGIVSFELAGSVSRIRHILDSWDEAAQLRAAFSLGLDFLFLVAYSTTIGFACLWAAGVARAREWPLAGAGIPLAWGQWLAALLDALENVALLIMLFGSVAEPWPQIARWCAVPKFVLVFVGLLYAALATVVWVASGVFHRG